MAQLHSLSGNKCVLHVGCGVKGGGQLHEDFLTPQWQEIRLDIDPSVKPDIVANMARMPMVPSASVDAVWSSHNVEHLFAHEALLAFQEFFRVLAPGGFLLMATPDLQAVAAVIAQGKLEDVLYEDSRGGPIAAVDIVFGYRPSLAKGNSFMAHRTGFTANTLGQKLAAVGFRNVQVVRNLELFELEALAYKP